ncbi:hypothetical protein GCM10010964_43960 [Caldovatus sediminis]|uniref:Transposase n=1 Tax=Caldovatus sediminis TaxID=2041189 RepID=A0A8J2ZFM9_9PROT|nr:hypothetical protein GCM10010964_43960 [Caldovatus sediminis]
MRRSRFTEVQILGILKEHEAGRATADLCRKHGISDQTLYNWKAKYGGLKLSEASRLKGLEDENREEAAGRGGNGQFGAAGTAGKKLIRPAVRFGAVERVMREHGYSERAACRLIGWIARRSGMSAPMAGTRRCVSGCANWPINGAGSATVGWRSCRGGRARR